jgi:hypothetical protein
MLIILNGLHIIHKKNSNFYLGLTQGEILVLLLRKLILLLQQLYA